MPLPAALVPILASAGVQIGGSILSRIIGGKRKELDLVTPAINEAQASLTDLSTDQRRQQALLEADLARAGSAGFSGAAAREDLMNVNARAGSQVRGTILDTLARARQQQETINTDAYNQQRINKIEGISQAAQSLGSAAAGAIGQQQFLDGLPGAAPQVNSNTINAMKGTYNMQQYYPVYGQLYDYNKVSDRIFSSLQQGR